MDSLALIPGFAHSLIRLVLSDRTASFHCLWRLNKKPEGSRAPFRTLDIVVVFESLSEEKKGRVDLELPLDSGPQAYSFLQKCVTRTLEGNTSYRIVMKLVLPGSDGHILHSNLMRCRLLSCPLIQDFQAFTTSQTRVEEFPSTGNVFGLAFERALGAILLKDVAATQRMAESALAELEMELTIRLSFKWITQEPQPRRRLAMIGGGSHPSAATDDDGPYSAASALGVDVVVLDEDGHWLQSESMGHLCDEFLVCDLTPNQGLSARIVATLRRSREAIHGVITFSDAYLAATAEAAESIGLWTNPPDSIAALSEKGWMRELTNPCLPLITTDGQADLKRKLEALETVQFPLVTKAAYGWYSKGVMVVDSKDELINAVEMLERSLPNHKYLVEPYLSGLEMHANFVLVDGEVLFAEVGDDSPSLEEVGNRVANSFAETPSIMPAVWPLEEHHLLRSSIVSQLGQLNLTTGLFYVEALVSGSKMEYRPKDTDLALGPRNTGSRRGEPTVVVRKVKVGAPRYQDSIAVKYTYGVDYYALYILQALQRPQGDKRHDSMMKSIRTLSEPLGEYIRYPTNVVFIPVREAGVFSAAEPLPQWIMTHIPHYRVLMHDGQVVEGPHLSGKWPFVAYFVVKASLSGAAGREQVKTLGEYVRRNFRYIMT